jgi:hypothetical protein
MGQVWSGLSWASASADMMVPRAGGASSLPPPQPANTSAAVSGSKDNGRRKRIQDSFDFIAFSKANGRSLLDKKL